MKIRHLAVLPLAVLGVLLLVAWPSQFQMMEAEPPAAYAPAYAPDWTAARDEAARLLSGMVRIDTSNPPGNEIRAAEYIRDVLAREGIPAEIFESQAGRGNVVARLKGNGKKRPILLMGHTDVVGVERSKWTVEPFGGIVKDGYVYGRGSTDDKGMTTACLETFILLKRLNVPLDRDVIFLAEADEEETGRHGITYMIERHWDRIAAEFALNEGGMILERDGRVSYAGVATTEKVPRGVRLVAHGNSGHGSIPRPDNAVTHLAAAVAKAGSLQLPMRLNETTRTFFQRLAKISPPQEAFLYLHLEDPEDTASIQETIRLSNLSYNSMLRTSIVPTMIKAGFRSNVIPADAEATLDVRALPDENMDALVEHLRKVIDDPQVEVIPPAKNGRPATPPSGLNTEMFRSLERAQDRLFPGAVTLPLMLTGATDSAMLRAKGVQCYGLGTIAPESERSRVHGNDERMSVKGLGLFTRYIYEAVTDVAASK